MEPIHWNIEGMTCSNCALSIKKYLESEGASHVNVNPITGKLSFENIESGDFKKLEIGIQALGYSVIHEATRTSPKNNWPVTHQQRFLFTLPFTAILMLHMLHPWLHIHWIQNGWIQLSLCIPVFIIGLSYFGKSALKSIVNRMPNMNVLVAVGALVSFVYSAMGLLFFHDPQYYFFETTASIITLVFLGNYLEEQTMQSTQRALKKLTSSQKVMANMIAFDDQHQELIFSVENTQLKIGDLILIKTGEQIPIDCKILWGECTVNESLLTGESTPIFKSKKELLIGGSVMESGTVKAQVTATGNATVLSGIINIVEDAAAQKPPMQKLADNISAIFIPTILLIALLAFVLNAWILSVPLSDSIMRSIAILVISCPCAMGLATPAAISVGLGRAARKGIIFKNASSLESFKKIKQVVFDKTGTLTTGKFTIEKYDSEIDDALFKSIVISLEKYSNHPIAHSIAAHWKASNRIPWKKVEEIKGLGIRAEDADGNIFEIGNKTLLQINPSLAPHHIYVLKNKKIIGWLDLGDEIRPESFEIIQWLKKNNIQPIMLTGDTAEKAAQVANTLGISIVFSEQSPLQKLEKITQLNQQSPTAMIGDGINDAAALTKATIGISISEASQLAIQQADVILMNNGLKNLPEGLGLGKHTYITIQQNLFWAFFYNIIAIPVAALGLLTPTFSAMAMGFSDIILAAISLHLFVKKVI